MTRLHLALDSLDRDEVVFSRRFVDQRSDQVHDICRFDVDCFVTIARDMWEMSSRPVCIDVDLPEPEA